MCSCSKVGKESSTKDTIDNDFVAIYDGPNDQSTKIKELKGDLGNFAITTSKLDSTSFDKMILKTSSTQCAPGVFNLHQKFQRRNLFF